MVQEIKQLADWAGTDPLRASARVAEGLIAAAAGEHEKACSAFDDAIALFARDRARYEVARVRIDLARSLLASKRADAARAELDRAARAFAELGAAGGARGVRALMDEASWSVEPARPGRLSARELEVLRPWRRGSAMPRSPGASR